MQNSFLLRSLAVHFVLASAFAFATSSHANTFSVTNVNDSGIGSLRAAITNVNATAGANTITFNLTGTPPFTINLSSALPTINNPVTIVGTNQLGYTNTPVVELNGAGISTAGAVGLQLGSSSSPSAILGLAINRFNYEGMVVNGASNIIQGNFIGTDTTGKVAHGNSGDGILVTTQGNLIGGTNAAARNIISGNGNSGIILSGSTATGNTIAGNYIGTDITGTNALANSTNGIQIDLAPANVVGPSNLISGNKFIGLYISGSGANSNTVIGNFIGTDVSGKLRLPNTTAGVTIYGCNNNQIGGRNSGNGNLISGNLQDGIYLTGGAGGTLVQGNLIGLSALGTNAIANGYDGITINGSSGNTIGGSASGARNIISGNTNYGVAIIQTNDSLNVVAGNYIGTDINGQWAISNQFSGIRVQGCTNTIGGTKVGTGNIISGNTQLGVWLIGTNGSAMGNLVAGNLIGLDYTGTNALGNGNAGVGITSASTNLIGGTSAAARNIISGNGNYGMFLINAGTTGNTIQGNYIGTDINGTLARGNVYDGIYLQKATNNQIGGNNAGAGNLISGNNANGLGGGNNGIHLTNSSQNFIQGNRIGTDVTGTLSLGNSWNAIYMEYSSSNQIGGTTAGAGNLLSGNGRAGINLSGSTAQIVQGNYIGTDISGSIAVANTTSGMDILSNSTNNLIGGLGTGSSNVISGNGFNGIYFTNASMNTVQGNLIGLAANGISPLGNNEHNIQFDLGSSNNILGGLSAGAGNSIAYAKTVGSTQYAGVRVRNGAFNNLISGNSIFNNNALGIDLGNQWVNPNLDCETGVAATNANRLQNYPILSNAASGTLATLIRGSFDSAQGKTYSLEFFASPSGDPYTNGEGQVFLGQTNLTLGNSCSTNFSITLPVSVPTNWVVTATATDPANNTSEFSNWITNIAKIPIPVASLAIYSRTAGLAWMISLADLATNWSDAGGYPVKLAAINLTTTNGVTLTTNNIYIQYPNNSPSLNDQFSYMISDGYGTNTGLVNITVVGSISGQIKGITVSNGSSTASINGIPGWTYNVQRATNLVSSWITLLTTNAPGNGMFQFTDTYSDLGGHAPAAAYYRLFWQP